VSDENESVDEEEEEEEEEDPPVVGVATLAPDPAPPPPETEEGPSKSERCPVPKRFRMISAGGSSLGNPFFGRANPQRFWRNTSRDLVSSSTPEVFVKLW
jgi:hypothetical protein